jgi:hypothetical protein
VIDARSKVAGEGRGPGENNVETGCRNGRRMIGTLFASLCKTNRESIQGFGKTKQNENRLFENKTLVAL